MNIALREPLSPAEQGYPRNQWYVAAFSREVESGLLARTLLDVPVVLYRTSDGTPTALHDKCPHKGLPLSAGKLCGNALQCGYHGIQFAANGGCIKIPQQDLIPPSMRVRNFPVVEKWPLVWIWMGEISKADPALMPSYNWLGIGRPGYSTAPLFRMDINANYAYLQENMLDNTHISFMHEGLLDDGELANAKFSAKQDGPIVCLDRETRNVTVNDATAAFFKIEPGRHYDRRHVTESWLPSLNIGRNIFTDPKNPGAAPVEMIGMQVLTPSNKRLTHMFSVLTTSYAQEWTKAEIDAVWKIVDQDRVALEAIQARFDEFGVEEPECSIRSDQAGMMCRRALTAMVANESTERNDASTFRHESVATKA